MNYYELLGVSFEADEQSIKRAWARLVRLHPPDKEPDTNQKLNEARKTLSDPTARADYDAQLQFGNEIANLFESANESMSREDYTSAISNLKEILAFHPKSFSARNFLALAYAYKEDYASSFQQYERLTSEAPDSSLYAANFGHVLFRIGGRNRDAEKWFKKAILLEEFNAQHHLALARLYISEKRFQDAEDAIEAAVLADGQTDIGDIDALMELTWVYLLSDQADRVPGIADRIAQILPDDPEARSYAAFKFLRTAGELVEDFQRYDHAEVFIRAARRIQDDFGEAEDDVAEIEFRAKADREADRMREDSSVNPLIVAVLISYTVHARLGHEFPDNYAKQVIEATATWTRTEIQIAVGQCRARYPNACKLVEDMLPELVDLGTSSIQPPRQYATSASSGCVLNIICGALGLISTVVLTLAFNNL